MTATPVLRGHGEQHEACRRTTRPWRGTDEADGACPPSPQPWVTPRGQQHPGTAPPGHRGESHGGSVEAGRDRGLHVVTLQAGTAGASVYRRVGFETVAPYRLFTLPQE